MKPFLTGALILACAVSFAQAPAPAGGATPADAKRLAKLETSYKTAKAALAKKPKDEKTKKAFAVAATQFGHESMVSPALTPRVKYRQALRVYREVLKLYPTYPVAREEFDLMVKIYKQMGRPVPQD
jgi:tetratricopeptide (TPR) repeat protein